MNNKNKWTDIFNIGGNRIKNIVTNKSLLQQYLKSELLHQVSFRYHLNDILVVLDSSGLINIQRNTKDILVLDKLSSNEEEIEEFVNFTIFRNVPIVIRYTKETIRNNNVKPVLSFGVFNTLKHRITLREFLDILSKKVYGYYFYNKPRLVIRDHNDVGTFYQDDIIRRTFDNVFMTDKNESEIVNNISDFINKKAWYVEHGLPYHLGILLYGKPGTGKTSIVQAISDRFNMTIYSLSVDQIGTISDFMKYNVTYKPRTPETYRIVLIEDIDCSTITNRNNKVPITIIGENSSDDGFGTLLNTLDGVHSPSNVIYIFTTNHIEQLDPALIRPGRIDLKLEINSVCPETLDKFLKFHFKKEFDLSGSRIKENLIFAELQVMVMRGMTAEEIIKEVTI